MLYSEVKKDLFTVDSEYYLAHCISSDCKMGAGIAVDFQEKFNLRSRLLATGQTKHPTCILVDNVFNLITKEKYWHKPTYPTITVSIKLMKQQALERNIKHIAMPRIGAGLDRLQWGRVKETLLEVFDDTDIELLVCYK